MTPSRPTQASTVLAQEQRQEIATMIGLLRRHGATNTVLHGNVFRRRLTSETLPVLPDCGRRCRYGLRLDCVLAHLEDAHEWTAERLASFAADHLGVPP